jgi:hypothetical protein
MNGAVSRVYFCAGDYCPGYHWPASNVGHPSSCAIERLNSVDNLRVAAASRRAHCRSVKWEPLAPTSSGFSSECRTSERAGESPSANQLPKE